MSAGPLEVYNGTTGVADNGGDSLTEDLNVYYSSGDFAWILTSSALVLLMVPGVGFFYSGLARRKSALALIWLSMMSIAVVGFQWFFWGYSLTFSHTGSAYIGDLSNFGLMKVLGQPSVGSTKIPDLLFCLYQGMFAAITPALAIGAVADRGRMLPALVFIFIWATIVYDPIAYWTWNANGWSFKLGGLDFAGGTPVHISSGAAALAYSIMLGKRTGYNNVHGLPYRPHNVTHVVLGTVFLWVGWFGFNGGSALAANLRAVMACIVTHIAACVGGFTWCLMDYRLERKWSAVGFCSGAIAVSRHGHKRGSLVRNLANVVENRVSSPSRLLLDMCLRGLLSSSVLSEASAATWPPRSSSGLESMTAWIFLLSTPSAVSLATS